MNTQELVGINQHNFVVPLHHRALKPTSDDAVFRRECPFCYEGILPVRRDPGTGALLPWDYCLLCGQPVCYIDFKLIGANAPS